jgi:hypothetical protein
MSNGAGVQWRDILKCALLELTELLRDDGVVSSYEMYSSGLVQALLGLLSTNPWDVGLSASKTQRLQKQRIQVFKTYFKVYLHVLSFNCTKKNNNTNNVS